MTRHWRTDKKRADLDLGLYAALVDLQNRCLRRRHGRVLCTVELREGVVVGHRCEESDLTEGELARIMTEKPQGWTP